MSYDSLLINTASLVTEAYDKKGSATKSVTPGIKCRIMYKNEVVIDFAGVEQTAHMKLFFKHDQTIDPKETKVQITGETFDRPIVKITTPQNSKVIHHKEVWLL